MSERRAADARAWVVLAYPVAMLGVFFLGPFLIMLAASFYRRIPGGFYEPAFVLDNWKQLLSELFVDRALFSLRVSLLAGWLAVLVAFPFTYALTTMPRRRQVALLVLVLSSLSLSEVIVGFSWSVLLGRAAGISNILVWLGLMDEAEAYAPGFWAVMLGLLSIAFPYCVLTMYPPLSRLDREVTEAAQMLGASPWRTFWTVVVPIARPTIVAGFLLVFVFTLGSYLISAILGRPEHWTVSVFISDQASFNANVPFAAAMALFLTIVSLAIVGAVLWFERRAAAREG
ncbi:MAG: spermidine/putrescine ABC transporter permease [Actinomycetota bacterium]|nr:MAG: spermidine/putrescine ABC transporter permease [Actinomycetota bacterium]